MAVINKIYNPSISVFFNSDGQLVIGDSNGDYGNGNENGWGGYNPPKSSITTANFALSNQAKGDSYILAGGNDLFDLLAVGLYTTTDQLLINADIYTDIFNFFTLATSPNNNAQFEQGIYALRFNISGQYIFGSDTIMWQSSIYITDVINLNSDCIESTVKKVAFSKNCKPNKKFSNLNMYSNMLFEYQKYNTLSGSLLADYMQRVVRINDIFQEIKGLCNGKNNCKC